MPTLQEDDGTIINLQWSEQDNLAALAMMEPSMVDDLYQHIKTAVAQYAPLDPSLGYDEWMTRFTELQTINEFTTALHVLSGVKNRARELGVQYEIEEPS